MISPLSSGRGSVVGDCLLKGNGETDTILGHGDKKKRRQALYLMISDADLLAAIDMMKFDVGETDMRTRR